MVTPVSNSTAGPGSSRLADMVKMANGLNAARAIAAILVVIVHSAVPYMSSQFPVLWVVHDTSQNPIIDVLVIGINGFVMPLFFLLAGMSIAKSSRLKPFREFAWHRLRRLGSTFLLAAVLILPLLYGCWAIGLLRTERLTMGNFAHMKFPTALHPYFGPAHLWFLEYLLLLSVGWSAISRCAQRWKPAAHLVQGKWFQVVLGSAWGPLAFAIPIGTIFAFDVDTPFRLITPFTPDVARISYYAVFLIAGVWLAGFPQAFTRLRANATGHLLIAAVAFIGLFPLTLSYFDQSLDKFGLLALGGLQAVFSSFMVFGFLGAMMRWCSDRRETIRYANEASFWLYLAHFPFVCIMQLVVWPWQINPLAKLLVVATTGVVVSLLIYQYCVRYSWLGAVINGSRKHHARSPVWRLEAGWLSLVATGMLLLGGFIWIGSNSVYSPNVKPVVHGQIYRSNNVLPHELEEVTSRYNIRSVIRLASEKRIERWFQPQKKICEERNIFLMTLSFDELEVPSSADIEKLQQALKNITRPVLIVGGKRSPTLAGFGSAVAVLVNDGSLEEAFRQLDMQYFQLEGAEHCVIAQPLREYRTWLSAQKISHSSDTFCRWTRKHQATTEDLAAAKEKQSDRQAMLGAPRFPRRF